MGWVRGKLYTLPNHDARLILMPYVTGLIIAIPLIDLDNIFFQAFKGGFVLFLLVFLCSNRLLEKRKGGERTVSLFQPIG